MTHSAPPTRAARPAPFTLTAEAGGYVLSCACKWLRYFATRPDADDGRREHEKRCKVAKGGESHG